MWGNRIEELIGLGVENVWFYAHQPGEKRELVVSFFNNLIAQLNVKMDTKLKLLKNYHS